jgi:hypothetical protein
MIETFTAETVRIRSIALPITLLALAGCAAEADVLSGDFRRQVPLMNEDAEIDAGIGPTYDATGADASTEMAYTDAAGGDADWLEELPGEGGTLWSACIPSLEGGRTGDTCTFVGGCARPLSEGCGRRTALCADLVLHLGEVSKDQCVPDDAGLTRRCAEVELGSCCIKMWQCDVGALSLAEGQPVAKVCALDCEVSMFPKSEPPLTGCPGDLTSELRPPWPPAPGTPCQGSFICDSQGNPASVGTEVFSFDSYGRIYWCAHGVMQRVATGPSLPWNG